MWFVDIEAQILETHGRASLNPETKCETSDTYSKLTE